MNRSSRDEMKITSARMAASTSSPELYSAMSRSQVITIPLLLDVARSTVTRFAAAAAHAAGEHQQADEQRNQHQRQQPPVAALEQAGARFLHDPLARRIVGIHLGAQAVVAHD